VREKGGEKEAGETDEVEDEDASGSEDSDQVTLMSDSQADLYSPTGPIY
jgi:hypothetical protein